jgi:glycosyltransferase involved in cell wall biosynthesis
MQSPKKLTIGMPTYDDYHGVYFSIQAIRLYNPEIIDDIDFVIIDNNPEGSHSDALKHFSNSSTSIKYVAYSGQVGPANAKNRVFEEAATPYVLCMDSHVLFEAGTLKKLLDYYENNPRTGDLLHGPLLYDDAKTISTHFDPNWRGQMYGTWATDERAKDKNAQPFMIEMCGCGVFSCRKDAWLGFNENFRGFGAEEGYIQEKFRQAGHQALCLPFFRWMHRFGRPDGVKYPIMLWDKVRNYFIAFEELGMNVQGIYNHFLQETNIGKLQLEKLHNEALTLLEKEINYEI